MYTEISISGAILRVHHGLLRRIYGNFIATLDSKQINLKKIFLLRVQMVKNRTASIVLIKFSLMSFIKNSFQKIL